MEAYKIFGCLVVDVIIEHRHLHSCKGRALDKGELGDTWSRMDCIDQFDMFRLSEEK